MEIIPWKIASFAGNRFSLAVKIYPTPLSPVVQLAHHPEDDWQPNWSPDGTKLAFTSGRDGDWEIYLMDMSDPTAADDSDLLQLTDNDVRDSFAAWSSDGQQIAFASMRDGDDEIYIMAAPDGMNVGVDTPSQLTDNGIRDFFPRWSPDGMWIVFSSLISRNKISSYDLNIMKPDGSGGRHLRLCFSCGAYLVCNCACHQPTSIETYLLNGKGGKLI